MESDKIMKTWTDPLRFPFMKYIKIIMIIFLSGQSSSGQNKLPFGSYVFFNSDLVCVVESVERDSHGTVEYINIGYVFASTVSDDLLNMGDRVRYKSNKNGIDIAFSLGQDDGPYLAFMNFNGSVFSASFTIFLGSFVSPDRNENSKINDIKLEAQRDRILMGFFGGSSVENSLKRVSIISAMLAWENEILSNVLEVEESGFVKEWARIILDRRKIPGTQPSFEVFNFSETGRSFADILLSIPSSDFRRMPESQQSTSE